MKRLLAVVLLLAATVAMAADASIEPGLDPIAVPVDAQAAVTARELRAQFEILAGFIVSSRPQ